MGDPDAADAVSMETAAMMPEEGDGMVDLGPATEQEMSQASGLQITGLRTVGGSTAAGHFSGLFSSSDSSEDDDGDASMSSDEGEAGRDHTVGREEGDFEQSERRRRRRPSTTEAKSRGAIDDDYDDDDDEVHDGREVFGLPQGRTMPQAEESSSGSGSSDDEGMVEIKTRRSS